MRPCSYTNPLSKLAASHTALVLLEYGCKVTLIDNYSNSFPRVFEHMKKLAGDKAGLMKFVKVIYGPCD